MGDTLRVQDAQPQGWHPGAVSRKAGGPFSLPTTPDNSSRCSTPAKGENAVSGSFRRCPRIVTFAGEIREMKPGPECLLTTEIGLGKRCKSALLRGQL